MIHRWLFAMLVATQMLGATAAPKPAGARLLTLIVVVLLFMGPYRGRRSRL